MKISAVTVCESYSQHLAKGATVWRDTLDAWIVVTSVTDRATLDLCSGLGIRALCTDALHRDPRAHFDKASAIMEGLAALVPADWILLVDADMQAPKDWRRALERCVPGNLYGAWRNTSRDPKVLGGVPTAEPEPKPGRRGELGGFFHLWHATDPAWTAEPTLGSWVSAGAYDTRFEQRWPRERRLRAPLMLAHSGRPDRDWCGAGRDAEMHKMLAARRARGGSLEEERLG